MWDASLYALSMFYYNWVIRNLLWTIATEIQKITNVGEKTGKRGLLYTAGETVTYSINYGKNMEILSKIRNRSFTSPVCTSWYFLKGN